MFLVLSGHEPAEHHQTVTNAAGQKVFELLANYQNRANGGNGWLRLLEFDEQADAINVFTYSPTLDQLESDSDSQFTLSVDFNARFGAVSSVPEPSFYLMAGVIAACLGWRATRIES